MDEHTHTHTHAHTHRHPHTVLNITNQHKVYLVQTDAVRCANHFMTEMSVIENTWP